MFDGKIYTQRRDKLKEDIDSGLLLFIGNEESPMNYPANPFHFRQDSCFLYFFGLDSPGLAAVIDIDEKKDILYGNDVSVEDIIWMGSQPLLKERGMEVGVKETASLDKLEEKLSSAIRQGRKIHYLPPYRAETESKVSRLLGIDQSKIKDYISVEFIKAVVEQRAVKIQEEIEQMERAHSVTYEMYEAAMTMAKPGVYEREIVGKMEGIALSAGCQMSFPTIFTINGQTLHNHYHGNILEKGRLIVADSGAESPMHYAADITRTFPVGGRFKPEQKEIYEIVLNAQETCIQAIKPGVQYRDIHIQAATIIAEGLKDLGLMKGDMNEAVKSGAHALFFPHGLGHLIGLDVHDMEDLGEDYVGYKKDLKRSEQFGFAYLRFAKELKQGHVLTAEPGIYFIPALIDKWESEKKFEDFIDYKKVNGYRDFGGVRIEDDVVVTEKGFQVLGESIPKTISELEDILPFD
jgi:Xaa-Pro aminopeptidase